MEERPPFVAVLAFVVLFIVFGLGTCYAPCSWYGCAPAKDVPGRCIGEMMKSK